MDARARLTLPAFRTIGSTFDSDPWLRDAVVAPIFAEDADGLPLAQTLVHSAEPWSRQATMTGHDERMVTVEP